MGQTAHGGESDKMAALLRTYEIDADELGKVLGMSRVSAMRRVKDPGILTVDDIRKLNQHGIPIEALRAAL